MTADSSFAAVSCYSGNMLPPVDLYVSIWVWIQRIVNYFMLHLKASVQDSFISISIIL